MPQLGVIAVDHVLFFSTGTVRSNARPLDPSPRPRVVRRPIHVNRAAVEPACALVAARDLRAGPRHFLFVQAVLLGWRREDRGALPAGRAARILRHACPLELHGPPPVTFLAMPTAVTPGIPLKRPHARSLTWRYSASSICELSERSGRENVAEHIPQAGAGATNIAHARTPRTGLARGRRLAGSAGFRYAPEAWRQASDD